MPSLPDALRDPSTLTIDPDPAQSDEPFWRTVPLAAMTDAQWESLCDGCGRCCLVKLEDEDTGAIIHTDVGCRLLDGASCRCRDYPGRRAHVPDCLQLTAELVPQLGWLPPTCAYRRLAEGRGLAWWHPLVSGDADTVHLAGISAAGRVAGSECDYDVEDLFDHAAEWPAEEPDS